MRRSEGESGEEEERDGEKRKGRGQGWRVGAGRRVQGPYPSKSYSEKKSMNQI